MSISLFNVDEDTQSKNTFSACCAVVYSLEPQTVLCCETMLLDTHTFRTQPYKGRSLGRVYVVLIAESMTLHKVVYFQYSKLLVILKVFLISDVVKARRGQTHLGTYLSYYVTGQKQASRHFLTNFLVISNRIQHSNFTDCFGGDSLACFRYQCWLSNFFFFSINKCLTLGRVSHLQTLYIKKVSSEQESRHFLTYNYITGLD